MSKYRIYIDGKSYEMEIELVDENNVKPRNEKRQDYVNYQNDGKNVDSVIQVINPSANKPTEYTDDEVYSPMPGTIISILVSEGEEVKRGQTVIILEAMKMENEITAPKDGAIKSINVEKGQIVQGNSVLFEME